MNHNSVFLDVKQDVFHAIPSEIVYPAVKTTYYLIKNAFHATINAANVKSLQINVKLVLMIQEF